MRKAFAVACLIGFLVTSSCSVFPANTATSATRVAYTDTITPIFSTYTATITSAPTETPIPTLTPTPTPKPTPTPYFFKPKMLADGIYFSYSEFAIDNNETAFKSYQEMEMKRLESLKDLTRVVYLSCDWNIFDTMRKVDELGIKVSLNYPASIFGDSKDLVSFCLNAMKKNHNVVEIRMDHRYDDDKLNEFYTIAKLRGIPTATIGNYDELTSLRNVTGIFDRRILSISIDSGNESVDIRTQRTLFNIAKSQKKWPNIDIIDENYDYYDKTPVKTTVETSVENIKNLWAIAKSSGGRFIMSSYEDYFTPEMSKIFDGDLPKDIWKIKPVLGEGKPEIKITEYYGNILKGQVIHLKASDYKVVLYIDVGGDEWWIKPYFNEVIWPDENGNFETKVATGGQDRSRSKTMILAIPTYLTPAQSAGSPFPQALYNAALAKKIIKDR